MLFVSYIDVLLTLKSDVYVEQIDLVLSRNFHYPTWGFTAEPREERTKQNKVLWYHKTRIREAKKQEKQNRNQKKTEKYEEIGTKKRQMKTTTKSREA